MTIDNSDVEHNLVGGIVRRPPPRFYTSQNSGIPLPNSPAFQIPRIRLIETLKFSRVVTLSDVPTIWYTVSKVRGRIKAMSKICPLFSLPIIDQRIGKVYSLANSAPRGIRAQGRIDCLVPPWDLVKDYKDHRIGEQGYTDRYRQHVSRHCKQIKRWMVSLSDTDVIYLC